jgi:hypothetical protein
LNEIFGKCFISRQHQLKGVVTRNKAFTKDFIQLEVDLIVFTLLAAERATIIQ